MRARRKTTTSNFGAGARESHDSTPFYDRFRAPDLTADEEVPRPEPVAEPFVHGDARSMDRVADGSVALVVTSPPYPGLIDYHEQHRYAYELLALDDRRERELGAAAAGTSRAAITAYEDGIVEVLRRAAEALRPGAPLLIVINDRRDLYPQILERADLRLEEPIEVAAYFVASEALANAAKHSEASRIDVSRELYEQVLGIEVEDLRRVVLKAEKLGGGRVYGPNPVDDHMKTGALRDPAGNVFGVYEHHHD